ncbi:penicillin acylase family protein [Actinophytocola xanthii]|uniref:Penicillin amidase n=1 Tax=Actinophytocola xanthii TaxID=1912961 RepID=A0A1Q8CK41_9PSEU|nr:penicillin acylase family protein [Actinophytocola xanthii]OLF14706.1 hypothetical protein BU204_25795 [Actinophytocola xanthii]
MTVLATEDGPVEITLDAAGRPSIEAPTLDAAAFGLGWVCATHRRAQLDLLRRRSHGRLAERVGPAAVQGDIRQRTLDLAGVADRCLAGLPADQRRLLEFHTAGVNLAGTSTSPWRPRDTVAVAQHLFQALVSDGADTRMVEVMRRTLPAEVVTFLLDATDEFATELDGTPPDPTPDSTPAPMPVDLLAGLLSEAVEPSTRVVVHDGPPVGSNIWAVARAGSVVLANDMHLELTDPSVLYAARLVLPGTELTGVTVPGLPMLIMGTNGRVAWGFTRLPGDVCELREVEEVPSGGYRVGEGVEQFGVRREVIRVRGGDDVVLAVRETRWGPVTGELAGRPVAFSSTLTDPRALDFTLARIATAGDANAAADVIVHSGLPPLNAVVADAGGVVLWTAAGRYPVRSGPGPHGFTTGEGGLLLPPEHLPRRVASPEGFIVNCNNGNAETREAGLAWNFFPGCRARRAGIGLAAGRGQDLTASARLQLDLDASYYTFYRDLALRQLGAGRADDRVAALAAEIAAWRGTAHRDEVGLALLVVFRDLVRERMFAAVTDRCVRYDDRFTYCFHGHERPLRRMLGALDAGLVPAPWTRPRQFVLAQLVAARALLTRRTGSAEPVRWGQVNRLSVAPHLLGIELSGCAESLLVAEPDFGAAVRFVVDLARPGDGTLAVPGAPSGASTVSQWSAWADGEADPLPAERSIASGRAW